MTYADVYVHRVSDIPKLPHWALLCDDSIHIPGDERSRTNPGHGYPAEDRPIIAYEAYLTQEKLMTVIRERKESQSVQKFSVYKVNPVTVLVSTSIVLGDGPNVQEPTCPACYRKASEGHGIGCGEQGRWP